MTKIIRVGTRKSLLARIQTQIVIDQLKEAFPKLDIQIVPVSTKGDERLDQSLASFGGKGVFTKELEEQLLSGKIDLAVHSAKDMPVQLPGGLTIGAVLGRDCTRDVFVTRAGEALTDASAIAGLPRGYVTGTGSLRRRLQLLAMNPGLEVKSIRGNVQTRLNKLADGAYDAIILAEAGLKRLMDHHDGDDAFDYRRFAYTPIDPSDMLPAAAQGILAVESRTGDLLDILAAIEDRAAREELLAERAFLQAVDGGCNAPAAALAKKSGDGLWLDALYSADGEHVCRLTGSCEPGQGEVLGRSLAMALKQMCSLKRGLTPPGKVWLIGAGPGDLGLISVRGLSCLKQADVIVYDHLAGSGLLNEVRRDAALVYAGKQAGNHYLSQEAINELLVRYAKEGKNVARLKGGDVFVFGRGGEEGIALAKEGIDFEVIPGISSAYAVPAYAGIPVTHRGLASSFHVITGHEDVKKTSSVLDYGILAREEGTLVFLMGLKNLPKICEQLIAGGKAADTPAAVISSGTTAHQRMASGTLRNIAQIAAKNNIQAPAITVIGDAAGLSSKLSWYERRPMAGKSVLITATKPMADAMAQKLDALGAQAIPFSLIETQPVTDDDVLDAYASLENYTWVVFTSRNGVDVFFEGLKCRRIDHRKLSGLKFAAIGDGTARALETWGIYCDYIPREFSSAAMAEEWVPSLSQNDRVLLLRARQASPLLVDALRARGIVHKAVALYETVPDWRKAAELLRILPDVDYVALCSASAVDAFYSMTRKEAIRLPKLVCIGPVTARAAKALGLEVWRTAKVYTIDGMIECINGDE